ncbi:hypothetical protein FCIRC_8267 [Fusarium circinatum]|uniref:Uncharacterized protein n=1 Tax=Fusarium circinatum TaxID=48490 RepID=A0A8H5TMB7_FUSCI|nr:hypothetical protein FCIRC_13993 [Fusarium circinatum]KAF5672833.1 hypothetical protein FCIRC_8267 [Fusarium circinatum]
MEIEQQKHAVAMQNSLATPTSLSTLEKLPAEIILMIGSELCPYGVNAPSDAIIATLVSKRLRTILLPRRFKNLTFSGSLRKLAQDMRSFLSGEFKHLMMTILSTLKSVTIRFEPYSHAERSTDLHLSTHRTAVVSEFIATLSSIDLISFDNQTKDEIGFLEALVQLPSQAACRHPLALQSAFPLLKGLKTDLSWFRSRSRTLVCMSSNILQRIHRVFPHLETLILDQLDLETLEFYSGQIFRKPHRPNLNEYVERLITQLTSMSRLRRFAFTLQKSWLCVEYDYASFYGSSSSSSGDESDDAMQTTPEPNEWPYWLPTKAQQKWWSELITRILKAVPQLEELCIMHSRLEYHRGTKIENIVTVWREIIGFFEKPSQFPYVLADVD